MTASDCSEQSGAWECAVCGVALADLFAADMHSAEHTDHYAIQT